MQLSRQSIAAQLARFASSDDSDEGEAGGREVGGREAGGREADVEEEEIQEVMEKEGSQPLEAGEEIERRTGGSQEVRERGRRQEETREGGSQETGMTQESIVQSDGDVGGKKEVAVLTNH